jgi:hypothetical protein
LQHKALHVKFIFKGLSKPGAAESNVKNNREKAAQPGNPGVLE